MSAKNKAKNAGKDVRGKAQEAMGKATGDKGDQAKGKAKQAEASTEKAVEDTKDAAKYAIDQQIIKSIYFEERKTFFSSLFRFKTNYTIQTMLLIMYIAKIQ